MIATGTWSWLMVLSCAYSRSCSAKHLLASPAMQVATPPRVNLLHLLCDPNGLRRVVVNWQAIARALLNQAHRRLAWARDEMLKALIDEVFSGYPGVPARWREPELDAPHALILPMELDFNGKVARMFSTVTSVARSPRCYVGRLAHRSLLSGGRRE